jgi:hypothetical protein
MTWAVLGEPGATPGLMAVFELGYVAMAVTLAWAGSLVWQRRTHPSARDAARSATGRPVTVRTFPG